jgi:plastocyanin
MRRLLLIALVLGALAPAVAVYVVSAHGAPAADGKLLAVVGPGQTISLATSAGVPVTRLDPGTYDIEIDDRSTFHNFHLIGPGGVNAATEVEFVGIRTVTVTLVNGQYTFVCDVHPYDMVGQFVVGTASTPPPPPPPGGGTTPAKLIATVGPKPVITLTKGGRKFTTLKAGSYTVTVRDRSPIHNFHLKGPGVNRRTGVAYTGTKTWQITVRSGRYRFVCDPHAQFMHGSFRVP